MVLRLILRGDNCYTDGPTIDDDEYDSVGPPLM